MSVVDPSPAPDWMLLPWLQALRRDRLIAIMRAPNLVQGERMAAAVVRAGFRHLEVTCDSDRPFELVQRLRHQHPHCWVGLGTVVTEAQLRQAIEIGAAFGFSPILDRGLLAQAIAASFPLITGSLTPNEISAAWRAGAPAVKVFPITAVGGARYLQNLRRPLAGIPLIPTGGVPLDKAVALLEAGAMAVGLGGALFPKELMITEDWDVVTKLAGLAVEEVNAVKQSSN